MRVALPDKVAVVTGAAAGIGRAVARGLAAAGARVCVNDINPDGAEATARAIAARGGEAYAHIADVANRLAVEVLFDDVLARWGRIDILVNGAAVEPRAPVLELDPYDWARTLDVNLSGAFYCTQCAGRAMRARGGGVILNLAGGAGRAAYAASQAGLIGLTRECAREFAAYGIRVNAVCPGEIPAGAAAQLRAWGESIPAGPGAPEDLVGVVLFLCSDASATVTGQAIPVDADQVGV